jgi:hypothetical protein
MVEDYTIETDESIIPLAETQTQSGGIVTRQCIKNRYAVDPASPVYGTFFFFKSPISRNIHRAYQKID